VRRRLARRTASHERWLVSYADFVTLLFALFLVLFVSAYRDRKDVTNVSAAVRSGFHAMETATPSRDDAPGILHAPAKAEALPASPPPIVGELQKVLGQVLGAELANNQIVMRTTPEGLVVSLHELGFFPSGEASLLPGAEAKIEQLAQALAPYELRLRIEGHTDNVPIHSARFDSNWELSTARATAVARLLIETSGFDPRRISIAGYGEYHPAASNDTPEGRQTNRRIDIILVTPPPASSSPEFVPESTQFRNEGAGSHIAATDARR
jgi:chemotaxis protein MotB